MFGSYLTENTVCIYQKDQSVIPYKEIILADCENRAEKKSEFPTF
jgi:hypothetical protein